MEEWKMDGKPGLAVLHMQENLLGEAAKHNPHYPAMSKAVAESGMVPRTRELLEAFRNRNLPIVFVNGCQGRGGLEHRLPVYGRLFDMIRGELAMLTDIEQARKPISELERKPDEPVLLNWLLGAFSYSGLDTWLRVNGVKTLVLTGFATQAVILNTTIQACDLWYSVVVPRDATTTWLTALGETVLNELLPAYALVTTTEDIIAHL